VAKTKSEKSQILIAVITEIRSGNPSGKFIKRDVKTKRWFDIGDALAKEKVSQSFRDSLATLYKSSNGFKRKRRLEMKLHGEEIQRPSANKKARKRQSRGTYDKKKNSALALETLSSSNIFSFKTFETESISLNKDELSFLTTAVNEKSNNNKLMGIGEESNSSNDDDDDDDEELFNDIFSDEINLNKTDNIETSYDDLYEELLRRKTTVEREKEIEKENARREKEAQMGGNKQFDPFVKDPHRSTGFEITEGDDHQVNMLKYDPSVMAPILERLPAGFTNFYTAATPLAIVDELKIASAASKGEWVGKDGEGDHVGK